MSDELEKPVTDRQFKALHVWCRLMADLLDVHGLDMRKTLKPEIEIPWDGRTVKEYIWKPVLAAMTLKDSTKDMSTVDPTAILQVIGRHFAEKHGIEIPEWPDRRWEGMGELTRKADHDRLQRLARMVEKVEL
jgi:hypothetical protein